MTGRPHTIAARLAGRNDAELAEPREHWSTQWMPKLVDCLNAIRQASAHTHYSDLWIPQTYVLTAGQSKHIVRRNPNRRRLVIWTDDTNTSAIWIGASIYNGDASTPPGPFDGFVALAPGSQPLELLHWGDVHAWCSSNGAVCKVEEYGRA